MNWSESQQKAIEERDSSVLVSAAAGSGKTAVMVERIIRMISDETRDIDLDRLIIMTFTRAAAQSMKEKISIALSKELDKHPHDRRLLLQKNKLARANISTIHSFCEKLIKQNYRLADVDPGFRLADESEARMLKQDIIDELIEEKLSEEDSSEFEELIDSVSRKADDSKLGKRIIKVYDFVMGQPHPGDYLDNELAVCDAECDGRFEDTVWFRSFIGDIKAKVVRQRELLEKALEVCGEADGPAKYEPAIWECLKYCDTIIKSESYAELRDIISLISFMRLPTIRKNQCNELKREFVKETKDNYKKFIENLAGRILSLDEETLSLSIAGAARINRQLLLCVRDLVTRYGLKKREKNLLDFNDLEHLAISILYVKEGDSYRPSAVADELSQRFEEIMIDEYQDSSSVQEALIYALSRERFGRPNVFMVGDVKQSIYRFRNAKPELFMEKYDSFSKDAGADYRKIELNYNFRSRAEVLDSVNAVFDRIMKREFGGIEYDQNARLVCRASFPDNPDAKTELLIVDPDTPAEPSKADGLDTPAEPSRPADPGKNAEADIMDVGQGNAVAVEPAGADTNAGRERGTGSDTAAGQDNSIEEGNVLDEYSADELEYKLIANRIDELTGERGSKPFQVRDQSTGSLRNCELKDITILVKTRKVAAAILEMLELNGIPAYFERSEGYFDAPEVEMMLDFLSIVDNPVQDIPLAAVLKSPIGGFTADELATIRSMYRESKSQDGTGYRTEPGDFYRALRYAADKVKSKGIDVEAASATPDACHDGGGPVSAEKNHANVGIDYVNAGESSQQAKAEAECGRKAAAFLEMLKAYSDKADILPVHVLLNEIYVNTGYYGYVSALAHGSTRRKNLDMLLTKAESYGKTSYQGLFNFVRYIENERSKGSDSGEVSDFSEEDNIVRISTIHKSKGLEYPIVILANAGSGLLGGSRGETLVIDENGIGTDYIDRELNIKYPGIKKDFIKRRSDEAELAEQQRLLYVAMTRAMDKLIITSSMKKAAEILDAYSERDLIMGGEIPIEYITSRKSYMEWILLAAVNDEAFDKRIYTRSDIGKSEEKYYGEKISRFTGQEEYAIDHDTNQEMSQGFDQQMNDARDKMPDESDIFRCIGAVYPYYKETVLKPKLSVSEIKHMQMDKNADLSGKHAESANAGALRGTAFHRAMALVSYELEPAEELKRLKSLNRFAEEEKAVLDEKDVLAFLKSGLALRMKKAAAAGRLVREKHFMAGFPARDLISSQDSSDIQILQGIIDAYFEEDGELIIVDYKTDRVKSEEELKLRYSIQLELYKKSLEQLTKKKVRECIIYSTVLNKEIIVES